MKGTDCSLELYYKVLKVKQFKRLTFSTLMSHQVKTFQAEVEASLDRRAALSSGQSPTQLLNRNHSAAASSPLPTAVTALAAAQHTAARKCISTSSLNFD